MHAIAIDFETANEEFSSACALGLAWLEDGAVTRTAFHYLRPPDLRFEPVNVMIHGIDASDVAGAPTLPEVLLQYADELSSKLVLAHFAQFDMAVLREGFAAATRPWPTLRYCCTAKLSRLAWPHLGWFGLAGVASHLGIEFQHHRANEDARAAALVGAAASAVLGTPLEDIPDSTPLRFGTLRPDGYDPCSLRIGRADIRALKATGEISDSPISGRTLVFTGALALMERIKAAQLAVNAGAIVQTGVTLETDILVVAGADLAGILSGAAQSGKLKKALTLAARTGSPEIMSEEDFYRACGMPRRRPKKLSPRA